MDHNVFRLNDCRPARALMVLIGLVLGLLLCSPSAARAHGGDLRVDVSAQATGTVLAVVVFAEDNHYFENEAQLEVTAMSDSGDVLGPTPLVPSVLGPGTWESPAAFLPDGSWTVSVQMQAPQEQSGSTQVRIGSEPAPVMGSTPAPPPPVVGTTAAAAPTVSATMTPAPTLQAAGETSSTWYIPTTIGAVVVTALVAGAVVVVIRRRRTAGVDN